MSIPSEAKVVAAGHICLDVIPDLGKNRLDTLLIPGKLVNVGDVITATGGSVPNTGLALHQLGLSVRLVGKVGNDLFGRAILDALRGHDPSLVDGMIVREGEQSSYSIVISPQGTDRIFLHNPGTNDTFAAEDIDDEALVDASLFHFGYPPLMKQMYEQEGQELEQLMSRVKTLGLTTSLDMSKPDPDSPAGRVDWRLLLNRVLPFVDLFLPSLEETLFMLDRSRFDEWNAAEDATNLQGDLTGELLAELAEQLLDMGSAIVVIKLGEGGLYIRTTADENRLNKIGKCQLADPVQWVNRELLVPCFKVHVAGTTGAGDCTIAGFLSGLLNGLSPEETMLTAVGVGACNVEALDATSGIPGWDVVQQRIQNGWSQLPVEMKLSGWRWDYQASLWVGPNENKGS